MVPADVALSQTQAFLTRVLPAAARVLEVGCGNGQLGWRLAHLGLEVVGLDRALPEAMPTHPRLRFEQGDFLSFRAEAFDAVLFSMSLHGLRPLEQVMRRTRNLLKPRGLMVLEELDPLAADLETARWYYEAQSLLVLAGMLPGERLSGDEPPLERWRAEHADAPEPHGGETMLEAAKGLGALAEVVRGPWLYRGISAGLPESARGINLAQWVLEAEQRRIAEGSLRAIGLRAVIRAE